MSVDEYSPLLNPGLPLSPVVVGRPTGLVGLVGYIELVRFVGLVGFGEHPVRTWDGTRPANGLSVVLAAEEGDGEEEDVGVYVYAEERSRGVSAGNRL